jgi:hypothetical protein
MPGTPGATSTDDLDCGVVALCQVCFTRPMIVSRASLCKFVVLLHAV